MSTNENQTTPLLNETPSEAVAESVEAEAQKQIVALQETLLLKDAQLHAIRFELYGDAQPVGYEPDMAETVRQMIASKNRSVEAEEGKARIRADHAQTAAHNEGLVGMPQGPCQCPICTEVLWKPEATADNVSAVLQKKLPDESGLWWWWNGDEDSEPIPVTISLSGGTEPPIYFANPGQWGWNRYQNVDEMGGWWCPCIAPSVGVGGSSTASGASPEENKDTAGLFIAIDALSSSPAAPASVATEEATDLELKEP